MNALRSYLFRGLMALGVISTSALAQSATYIVEAVAPASGTISPGQTVTVEVFMDNVTDLAAPTPDLVAGYQVVLEIIPGAGATGSLSLNDPAEASIFIDTDRPDWVYADSSGPIDLAVPNELKIGALVFFAPFPEVASRKYCGTYTFVASQDALGDFTVRFKPVDSATPDIFPNQIINQNSIQVPFSVVPPGGLTVSVVDVAPNDSCAGATLLSDGVTSFSTDNASTDGPGHPGSACDQGGTNTITNDIWFDYTASCSGILTASTCASANFDTRVAVYDGCSCPASDVNLLACDDDASGCGVTSLASVNGVFEGNCYKIRVGGTGNVAGVGSLTMTCIGNDLCGNADALSLGSSVLGSTQGTTANDFVALNCGEGPVDSPGVWYTVVGTGDRMRATLASASFDTRLTVYEGSCGSPVCVGDANNPGATQESVTWCSTSGVVYRILVHGVGGATGSFSLNATGVGCGDGNACTNDTCSSGSCFNTPNYEVATQCCNPSNGALRTIDDANPCTTDTCNTNNGLVSHVSVPNGPNAECDDRSICTLDECTAGACTNEDINAISCQSDLDCPSGFICGDGTNGTVAGLCFCDSGPTLDLVLVDGAFGVDACYGVGEIVQVLVEMGVAEEGVVGAQFFISYDPATLDFLSIEPGIDADPTSPFAFEFTETINEISGTIDYLVAINFGETPTLGPETVAVLTFEALAECDAFVNFRTAEPNKLTGSGGVEISPILFNAPPLSIDQNPPVVASCPTNVTVGPDPGQLAAVVTWAAPAASDACDAGPVSVVCSPASGSTFPVGTTQVSCTAIDSCGLVDDSCSFNVTVEPPVLSIDLELSASMAPGPFQRCIEFDLWDCDGPPVAQHVTLSQEVSFANGVANAVQVALPGGAWECVSVRDPLHTLSSTAADFSTADGINYTATVRGARGSGGHWLVGGNLNGDDFIDILDFGVLFPLHLSLTSASTTCSNLGPDGNINGDTLVDLLDLVMFVGNSLKGSEPACCGAGAVASSSGPIMSITVEELRAMGLDAMIAADVNRDGVLDQEDIALVAQGYVPPEQDPRPRRVEQPKRGRRSDRVK